MKYVIDRLKEPSTYAGLVGLWLLFGGTVEGFDEIVNAIAGLAATIAIFLAEGSTDE